MATPRVITDRLRTEYSEIMVDPDVSYLVFPIDKFVFGMTWGLQAEISHFGDSDIGLYNKASQSSKLSARRYRSFEKVLPPRKERKVCFHGSVSHRSPRSMPRHELFLNSALREGSLTFDCCHVVYSRQASL